MRFLKLVVLLLIFCLVVSGVSIAEEPIELQRIIITPNRFSQEFSESAAEITIISEEDIKNCGSQNLLDVLRPVKGILVKDYYGTGAKASVDMRGFGETAGNNVLVLVDGRRVNEVDLSGVNWAQIPVDRVKTIEILHGGTGAVLYGDNAVGGVINIITKEGDTDIPEIEIAQTVGSYQFNKQSVNAAGKNDSLSYSLNATRFDTNGYRENSEYRSFDAGVKLKYALTDYLKLKFSANSHEADFGLPGPLSLSDLETYSRRDSKSTEENNDVGEKDNYIKFGIEGMTFDIGTLNLDFAYRNKLSDTYWGTYSTINSTY
ncbi:MAG: TonB-dependent receptor plug domain-containing protein, partial [Candidatus Gygaella obscura]|nr:TonB-dependent receptor plug domain-containing protein [Candidatus Gygaella obscura]